MSSLRKNLMLLRRIGKSNPRARKALLKNVDKEMVQCICECAHNTIYSNVPVTKPQFKKLSRHKRLLRQLAKKGESWKKKKKVILRQSGGFLLPLLAPILGSLLGSITL